MDGILKSKEGLTLVEITADDADFIASAKDLGFKDAWSKQMLINSFSNGGFCGYIAKIGEKNVGFITATMVQDFADIESVFVAPNYRGKGIAKALLTALIEYLTANNVVNILLEVRATNLPAISLYQSSCFNQISIRKKYYSDGEDALVLKR